MDVKAYFQKVRDTQAAIASDFPIVVSLDTSDGGRSGRRIEVTRSAAARLLVDGKARMATQEETEEYHASMAKAREDAELHSEEKLQALLERSENAVAIRSKIRQPKRPA